ncbi:MAG: CHAD domain-containing protein [Acidobacteria bacterium]|nr:MAG: CHAD domain-containing protein [Acidobacteriota bacterium]GIK78772.1 MAG: hypothetical protein BroJett022_24620 [Actinomycetes bacterium]
MAKAREVPGLDRDLPFGEVAARVLEVRCRELIDSSAGVLDTADVERVHDMRVATRRLRAALEIFRPCLPAAAAATLKEVKGLADALGRRRDADVAIAMLTDFAAAMPYPDRRGIASLIDELSEDQRVANGALAAPADPRHLAGLEAAIGGLAAAARAAAAGGGEPS